MVARTEAVIFAFAALLAIVAQPLAAAAQARRSLSQGRAQRGNA